MFLFSFIESIAAVPSEGALPLFTRRSNKKFCLPLRFLIVWKVKVLVVQLCPTLCNPVDCSLPGPSVHGIFQARILERVAISSSRDWTQVSCIGRRILYHQVTWEALNCLSYLIIHAFLKNLSWIKVFISLKI